MTRKHEVYPNVQKSSRISPRSAPKPRVCLNMIVKDEAHVIEDCLTSIVHLIDYYVINDTGSTDDTKERIKAFFDARNIKGEIVTHEFRTCSCHVGPEWKRYEYFHFGWNRTYALQQCRGKSDYIFIMDADDVIEGTLKFPKDLLADQYYLKYRTDFNHYLRPQLIRNSDALNWSYADGLHEFLTSDNANVTTIKLLGDYTINSRRLGARNYDLKTKYLKDVAFLKILIDERPDYPRYRHYYAQSYYDAQMYAESIKEYTEYLPMEKFDEARHLARLMIGKAYMRWMDREPKVDLEAKMVEAFETCHREHPEYAEPMYELCRYFNSINECEKAFKFGSRAVNLPVPLNKVLPVNQGIYDYQLLDEMTWCASETGRIHDALKFTMELLERNKFPEERRDIVMGNLAALRAMTQRQKLDMTCFKSADAMVAGVYIGPSPTEVFYGSELAALNLARALAQTRRWDAVVIFLDAYPPSKEVKDALLNGSEVKNSTLTFLPSSILTSWNMPAKLDVMIVSRYVKYFVEVDAASVARRTYMWLHDVDFHPYLAHGMHMPLRARPMVRNIIGNIAGVVCSSSWHKGELLGTYGLAEDSVHVVGLGIDANAVQQVLVEDRPARKRNRFIWVADESRDLDVFLTNIFPAMTAVLHDTELLIFREVSVKLQKKAVSMKGVTLCGHASNLEILKAMATCDYFAYISEFKETFCLSALEAQAMGCICIVSPVAALETTVGDRGFTIKSIEDLIGILKDLNENPEKKVAIRRRAQEWAIGQTWDAAVSGGWLPVFDRTLPATGLASSSSTSNMRSALQRLKRLGLQPEAILDIGANVGDWNLMAKGIFPSCKRIISYEANPACKAVLEERGIEHAIVMLGDSSDCVKKPFYIESSNSTATGASIFREQTQFYAADAVVVQDLPMHRLDDLAPQVQIDIMKLDVQGAELLVLKGASETLQRCDFVIMEVALMQYNAGAPLLADVIAFMKDHGFLAIDVIENHYIKGIICVQCDIMFLRRESTWAQTIAESVHPMLTMQGNIFGATESSSS